MAVPSSPGWKFGYVPSPGEWNNTFAGKVDFPAPLDQGGTGGQSAYGGNYNLQQRAQISATTASAAALTFYSVRTDITASTITLPPANGLKPGDWVDVFDSGDNAATNNITITASGSDTISSSSSSAASLVLQNNGARCILVTDGVSAWYAQTVTQSTGVGLATSGVRTITASETLTAASSGYLCLTLGAGIVVTLPSTGFPAGAAVAFNNSDPANSFSLVAAGGDVPNALAPGDSVILVADGTGNWWKIAYNQVVPFSAPPPRQIADTAYTLVSTDSGQYLQFTSDDPVTVTVPADADVAFLLGSVIIFEQYGEGTITLTPAAGVTLNGRNGLNSAGQFAVVQIKSGSDGSLDTWTVLGDTTV